jgi:sporulation protein YlmC with PRC-barrel domain
MKKLRKLNSTLIAATLCVASAGWTAARAQDVYRTPADQPLIQQSSQTTAAPVAPETISKCSQLIGTRVENQQGENLGRITDVVVSFNNNQVSYCVLSPRHGIFGKRRLLAVPLAAFQTSPDASHLILNASPANLAKARGFGRDEWPSEIVPAWGAEPGPAVELPPSVVYGQTPAPVPPIPQTWVASPISYTPYFPQNASYALRGLQDQVMFGAALMDH